MPLHRRTGICDDTRRHPSQLSLISPRSGGSMLGMWRAPRLAWLGDITPPSPRHTAVAALHRSLAAQPALRMLLGLIGLCGGSATPAGLHAPEPRCHGSVASMPQSRRGALVGRHPMPPLAHMHRGSHRRSMDEPTPTQLGAYVTLLVHALTSIPLAPDRTSMVLVFSMHHAVKIPWASALPPDAWRDAPHANVSPATLREHMRLAADRLPASRRVRAALERTRGRAHERAHVGVISLFGFWCSSFLFSAASETKPAARPSRARPRTRCGTSAHSLCQRLRKTRVCPYSHLGSSHWLRSRKPSQGHRAVREAELAATVGVRVIRPRFGAVVVIIVGHVAEEAQARDAP